MPLHPELEPLARFLAAQQTPFTGRSAEEVRAAAALFSMTIPAHLLPAVDSTEDLTVDGGDGTLPARVYRPEGRAEGATVPTIVFFHGGGFVLGSVETHDGQARELCRRTGSVVVSVDYRLAPEALPPKLTEDAIAATRWALDHVDELGGDPGLVAVAGDSAGGNLAAVVAQVLRDRISAALLIYPVVDMRLDQDYPSYTEHGEDGVILTAEQMTWFNEQYVGSADAADPLLSPLLGDLTGLPPTVVTVAEMDPLRDQGRAYAAALEQAGVATTLLEFEGMIHGYFALGLASPAAVEAVEATCAALSRALGIAPVAG